MTDGDDPRRLRTREAVLAVLGPDPFARWELAERLEFAVALGSAVAVLRRPAHHHASLTFLGDDAALLRLVRCLAETGAWPEVDELSLTVPRHLRDEVEAALAARFALGEGAAWTWMWTLTPPAVPGLPAEPVGARLVRLDDIADAAELAAFAAAEHPGSEGYPGTGATRRWVGVRDGTGRLVATAGLQRNPAGTAHLAGIVVAHRARSLGWGRVVTAAITRDVLHGTPTGAPEPVCTLSLYADNAAALASYERLGYLSVPSWASHLLVRH